MKNGCPRWSVLALPLLAALGCSDPVPRPAQGNLTLSIQKPEGAGNCPVPGNQYVIAAPPGYHGPNTQMAGDRLVNGQNSSTIKCSVQGNSTFNFSGTISGTTHTTPSDHVTFTITSGTINMDKMTGTATVGVNTNGLAGNFTSPAGDCTVTVVGDNVKPGSIWATIKCPNITDPTGPGRACRVGETTTFVFENCEGA